MQNQDQLKFNLTLTTAQADVILTGLSKLAYEVSAPIIQDIMAQAKPQLEAPVAEEDIEEA